MVPFSTHVFYYIKMFSKRKVWEGDFFSFCGWESKIKKRHLKKVLPGGINNAHCVHCCREGTL